MPILVADVNFQYVELKVVKHYDELILRQVKVYRKELNKDDAEKLNAESLLLFHEKLTKILNLCNIKILSDEESK